MFNILNNEYSCKYFNNVSDGKSTWCSLGFTVNRSCVTNLNENNPASLSI